eukprot:scaffold9009_cov130-Isochrysis_galbana.AAC.13
MAHPLTRVCGLAPPHASPLGRHTLILTTTSSPPHPDCFRCLAAPPRERAKPGGPSLAPTGLPLIRAVPRAKVSVTGLWPISDSYYSN